MRVRGNESGSRNPSQKDGQQICFNFKGVDVF